MVGEYDTQCERDRAPAVLPLGGGAARSRIGGPLCYLRLRWYGGMGKRNPIHGGGYILSAT